MNITEHEDFNLIFLKACEQDDVITVFETIPAVSSNIVKDGIVIACTMGHLNIVKTIFDSLDSTIKNKLTYSYSSLFYSVACRNRNEDIAIYLIQNGLITDMREIQQVASINNCFQVLRYTKSEFESKKESDNTGSIIDTRNLYKIKSVLSEIKDKSEIFRSACEQGDIITTKFLLPFASEDDIYDGVMIACKQGDIPLFKFLTKNIDELILNSQECFRVACYSGRQRMAKFLIREKFVSNVRSIVTIAVLSHCYSVIVYILRKGADIRAVRNAIVSIVGWDKPVPLDLETILNEFSRKGDLSASPEKDSIDELYM